MSEKITHTFYDRAEPIIVTARALQRREGRSVAQVQAALQADARSHYAQALKMDCRYLVSASAFLDGSISAEELREWLDIGRPGWDGKSV